MPTVFLSYSSKDGPFAERLYQRLDSVGVRVWRDGKELHAGEVFGEKIAEAVKKADYTVVVLSHNSVASGWVKKEVMLANKKENDSGRMVVVPIRIDDCSPPDAWALDLKQCIDFSDPGQFEARFAQLRRDLGASFDVVEDDANLDLVYDLHPIGNERIWEIPLFGQRYFKITDCLPPGVLPDWNARDPNAIRVMRNACGQFAGFFIVLFLNAETQRRFARGEVVESEIAGSGLLAPGDPQGPGEHVLYISAVVARPHRHFVDVILCLYLVRYIDLLRRHRRVDRLSVLAVSEYEEFIARRFGFRLETPGHQRRDGGNYFELDISAIPDLLAHLSRQFRGFRVLADAVRESDDWKPAFPG
jgi:TIR domain